MPVSLIRILFDRYTRQKSRVAWGTYKSQYVCMYNGAKRGAIISPILFTDYSDDF